MSNERVSFLESQLIKEAEKCTVCLRLFVCIPVFLKERVDIVSKRTARQIECEKKRTVATEEGKNIQGVLFLCACVSL